METTNANWSINLMANCPYCEEFQDIMGRWHEMDGWEYVKVGETKTLSIKEGNEDFICECK
jgi:hypothetical protein